MVSLAVPRPEHRPDGECPVSRTAEEAGRDRDYCTEGMPERRWLVIGRGRGLFAAATGGGPTVRGVPASATARSRWSWATAWRRGSRRVDRTDARSRSSWSRCLLAARTGTCGGSTEDRSTGDCQADVCQGLPRVRADPADIVSDGTGRALRGFGSGRRRRMKWNAGDESRSLQMVETQLADDALVSRPPSPRGQRAGGPHTSEGITRIGRGSRRRSNRVPPGASHAGGCCATAYRRLAETLRGRWS